jgi:hypothetical protein
MGQDWSDYDHTEHSSGILDSPSHCDQSTVESSQGLQVDPNPERQRQPQEDPSFRVLVDLVTVGIARVIGEEERQYWVRGPTCHSCRTSIKQ